MKLNLSFPAISLTLISMLCMTPVQGFAIGGCESHSSNPDDEGTIDCRQINQNCRGSCRTYNHCMNNLPTPPPANPCANELNQYNACLRTYANSGLQSGPTVTLSALASGGLMSSVSAEVAVEVEPVTRLIVWGPSGCQWGGANASQGSSFITQSDCQDTVEYFVADTFGVSQSSISGSTNIRVDLGASEGEVAALTSSIANNFGVTVSTTVPTHLETVSDITNCIMHVGH